MTSKKIQELSNFINLESFERFKEYFTDEICVLDKYSYYCLYLAVFHDTASKTHRILGRSYENMIDISDFTELIKRKMQNIPSITHFDILSDFKTFYEFIDTNKSNAS